MNRVLSRWARSVRLGATAVVLSVLAACGGGSGKGERELTTACAEQAVQWTVGGNNCSVTLPQTKPNATAMASSVAAGTFGQAQYRCVAAQFTRTSEAATCASGASVVQIDLTAERGRWYDYFSEAFTELGRIGFWKVSALQEAPENTATNTYTGPYETQGAEVRTQYPKGANWTNFARIAYTLDGYSGVGDFNAPIRGVQVLLHEVVDGKLSALNIDYETRVPSGPYTGHVRLRDNQVIGVELNTTLTAIWPGTQVGDLAYTGPLDIGADGRFSVQIGPVVTTYGNFDARWFFVGRVNQLVDLRVAP